MTFVEEMILHYTTYRFGRRKVNQGVQLNDGTLVYHLEFRMVTGRQARRQSDPNANQHDHAEGFTYEPTHLDSAQPVMHKAVDIFRLVDPRLLSLAKHICWRGAPLRLWSG
jgi:hypothetical protein